MTNQIKIAVVGVGRWGVHLLRNFLENPQVAVAAVVDPNSERLATVQRQYFFSKTTEKSVLLTTEWQKIKQITDLDAVVIATPASTHYSLITDALDWGYHVLAEKPLTLNLKECHELCQLAQKRQRQLMVDHTYLFHPAVERGQVVVQEGELGDLRYGYACRTHLGPVRQDVDALWDLAIHDIAIFNTWLGQQPVSVQASGRVWLQEKVGKLGEPEVGRSITPSPHLPISPSGLADLVWVTLTYPNGFQAYIHLCWLNPDKQRRLVVVGSRGSLIFDEMSAASPLTLMHGELEMQANHFIPVNQSQQVLQIEKNEPLKRVCDRFVHCIHNNTPCMVSSGWIGTQLVNILAALTESLNQNGKLVALSTNQY
ncbi:oxidoreductase [Fischerella thermalis CCMEE 5198]|jgi:predicted dehydrogenase|uniref:Gfo/Idh/MocA family protein n=1 Tax=Fischerella thermalis TaxID=372787 RepID=UPI000C805152|nr:Gfo/Idh/MocA family oxidoreductase [Fischerella thermalis]PMB01753.1 oxidoreductase [Fischerella thermalis CCMEE 5196]PMB23166.1 oxidoreductase [Fischerella thermalis CCMEE 5198]